MYCTINVQFLQIRSHFVLYRMLYLTFLSQLFLIYDAQHYSVEGDPVFIWS